MGREKVRRLRPPAAQRLAMASGLVSTFGIQKLAWQQRRFKAIGQCSASSPSPSFEESQWRKLLRELERAGLDQHDHPWRDLNALPPIVSAFLHPISDEELAAARIPGRARAVAGAVMGAVQTAKALAAEASDDQCNVDRTPEELALRPPCAKAPFKLVIDGLAAEEVGVLLRTCEAANVEEVLLLGDTPGPPDSRVLKTSLGAEALVACRRYRGTLAEVAGELREQGHTICCIADASNETKGDTPPILDLLASPEAMRSPLVLVVGRGPNGATPPPEASCCDVSVKLGSTMERGGGMISYVAASAVIYEVILRWDRSTRELVTP